jgi:copper homeostasis protein
MIVEVCANSLQSAIHAERGGADRIELCTELGIGGITPSHGLLQKVRDSVSIPIHVLIRPRSGGFNYSEYDYEVMCRDVVNCARLGFQGVVAGVLQEDLTLDLKRTEGLMALRGNMHFTFHRAIDWLPDPLQGIPRLEAIGVDTILSSGQAATAVKGLSLLKEMLHTAKHASIMPGAGIGLDNARLFRDHGFSAIHLSGTTIYRVLTATPAISMVSPSYISDVNVALTMEETIRSVVESVK